MTDEELNAIDARANAATPGKWKTGTGYEQSKRGNYVCGHGRIVCAEQDDTDCVLSDEDAAFIAAARADVPALVAEVRRLKALVREQELTGLGAVLLVAEVERLREIEAIVRRMVHDDLTVQHPGSDTVRRLVELLKEAK